MSGSTSVDNIILAAEGRVNMFTADLANVSGQAQQHLNDLQALDVEVDRAPDWTPDIQDLLTPVELPSVPTLNAGHGISPQLSQPTQPSWVGISPVTVGTSPVNPYTAPVFNEPLTVPSPLDPFFGGPDGPKDPPTIRDAEDFTFPSVPNQLQYQVEDMPTITDRVVPDAPEIVFPEFIATDPGAAPESPTDLAERYLEVYREQLPGMVQSIDGYMDTQILKFNPQFFAQMERLENKLASWIDDGGTALKPEIEEAIWDRSRERQAGEFRRVQDTAWSAAAAKGFTMPNGAVMGAILTARMAEADANTRTSNEIAIKQAELEQQNIQFAITTSADLRKSIINAALAYVGNLVSINGQASDAAKAIVQALVDVYNGQVKEFEARLTKWKAEADIYEVQHRGLLAQVEIYKAQLAALEAQTGVDTAKLQAYKTKMDSLQTLANVYRAQVDAVIAQAGLEKLKLEQFDAQVRVYAAKVQAKNAEWSGYEAQLRGRQVEMQTYDQELKTYLSEVDVWQKQLDSQIKRAEFDIRQNEALLRQYQAEWGAYESDIKAQSVIESSLVDAQKIQLQSVQAKYQQAEAEARLNFEKQVRAMQFTTDGYRFATDTNFRRLNVEIDRLKYLANFVQEQSKAYGNLLSSAMSGMNTLASVAE